MNIFGKKTVKMQKFELFTSNESLLGEKILVLILASLSGLVISTFPQKISVLFFLVTLVGTAFIRYWKWWPLFLLLFIWYVPGQTAPGGLLENYIAIRWLTYIIIPLLFVGYFIPIFLKDKWDMTPIFIPLMLIVLCISISAFINGSNLFNTASAFGIYLRYPLLFLVFVNMRIEESVIKKVIQLIIILTLLQIPEVLARHILWDISGDMLSWTLGPWGTFPLGIYCIYSICIVSAIALITGLRWYHPLLLTAFIIPAGIGEIKMLIICAPIVLLVVLLKAKKLNIFVKKGIPLLFAIIMGAWLMYANWEKLAGYDILNSFLLDIKHLFLSTSKSVDPLRINRIGQVFLIWDIISDNFKKILFGFGPGSSLAGNFLDAPGVVDYLKSGPSGQLVAIMGDLGILGLILYLGLLLVVLNFAFRYLKEGKEEWYKALATAFLAMWVFYVVLGPIYNLIWRYDGSSLIFWFVSAVIYKKIKELRNLKEFQVLPNN